ncbi:hypothetical protein, partial [Corynebacterium amycolatum]|uniref:hypothetical protein n=1 Tax=Corynebacterium amycolatum TaxID=43765 RepID=UPI001CD5158F
LGGGVVLGAVMALIWALTSQPLKPQKMPNFRPPPQLTPKFSLSQKQLTVFTHSVNTASNA